MPWTISHAYYLASVPLLSQAEELKREADIRKQETEEALSRLTLVKDELKIRGKEADDAKVCF